MELPRPASASGAKDRPLPMPLPLTPIGRLPFSAASGLVELREMLWTVADDETVLVGSRFDGPWDQRIELVADRLPFDPAARKRRKPDFEAIAILPDERLFVLGSGSTPARRRGVVVDVRERVPRIVDLSALHRVLEAEIPELNLEGAVVHGDDLFLAQRGNGPRAQNALVRLDLARVLESLARLELGPESLDAIVTVELPDVEGVPLGLTDLASDGAEMYFSAAAEQSASTYEDGACRGSAIGRLSVGGVVTALRETEGRAKIEGLSVKRSRSDAIRAWLVADPDDRDVMGQVFRIDDLSLR